MITVCSIFCQKQSDLEVLSGYLKTHPVFFTNQIDESKPTLIVGWEYVKQNYLDHNILDKKISNNLFWAFSKDEDEKKFFKDTKLFVENCLLDWLPKDFVIYDYFFDGNITDFVDKNIDREQKIFLYHKKGALYVNNDNRNFVFNIQNIVHFGFETRESLTKLFNDKNTVIFSYHNMKDVFDLENFIGIGLDSLFWVLYSMEIEEDKMFNILPNFNFQKYISFFMNVIYPSHELDNEELAFIERMRERDLITNWLSDQDICVNKTIDLKNKKLEYNDGKYFVKVNYSNKRTLTNRIVCKDEWNVQNEPKDSARRRDIRSRFEGGKILVVDYTSFESRISIFLTKDVDFIRKYRDHDIHNDVAEIIFPNTKISDVERKVGKTTNHTMIYGGSNDLLLKIVGPYSEEPEETLYYIRKLLAPIISNSKKTNEECHRNGFIKTPWGSIIRPDKEYAAYNNLIQTIASEILVDKMIELKEFLKNKKSRLLFQIHDSIVFDVSPEDENIISDIIEIMSKFKKSLFSVDYKIGENYMELFERGDLVV